MIKILTIVSDQADVQEINTILSDFSLSHTVNHTSSIGSAIQLVERNPPDLIILGMSLSSPKIDTLFEKIKQNKDLFIPVILLIEQPQKGASRDFLKQGIMDIITKPFSPEEIKIRIMVQLKFKKMYDEACWIARKSDESIKLLYRELEKKNEELEKLDNLKSRFISTVSHELRTPLTTMKEFTGILSDEIPGKLTKDQHEYIDIIKNNIDRLVRLIEDLLDISRIESGKAKLNRAFVNIVDLVENALTVLKPVANKKNITLKSSFDIPSLDIYLDPDRITQVFTNLIGNAVKFTPEGGQVTVDIEEDDEKVKCSITDTGRGIAPENFDKLFGKFQRLSAIPTSNESSTGLGLSIVKQIARPEVST